MQARRVCEVYAPPLCGSGYLIADALVLTAAHVAGELQATVQIRMPFSADHGLYDAQVVWKGSGVDAALLLLSSPGHAHVAPVRWGRLVSTATRIPCEASGFPEALVTRNSEGEIEQRDVEQVSGTINPLSRAKAGMLDLSVTSASPDAAPQDRPSPWGGMSGAAVWSAGLLTGVVTQDPAGFGSRRITAVPAAAFLNDAKFADLVCRATGRIPAAEPVELAHLQVPEWPVTSPAALLRAEAEAVPFHGRGSLLEELQRWCERPGQISALLLTGPGGQGKSRLARQMGHEMAARGWAVLHLADEPPDSPREADAYGSLATVDTELLVIVDYAETRRGQLRRMARHLVGDRPAPVRMLMIARTGGDWMSELMETSPGLAWLSPTLVEEIALPPLETDSGGWAEAFAKAIHGLAAWLPSLDGQQGINWPAVTQHVSQSHERDHPRRRYDSILAVQMAALADLLAAGHDEPIAANATVENVLLGHEARYWNGRAERLGMELPNALEIRRGAVAIATVCGAADHAEAVATIARIPGFGDQPESLRQAAVRWLHELYPAPPRYWGSVQPDRLAEHLSATTLTDRPDLLNQALALASPRQAHNALTVLIRAAASRPHIDGIITELVCKYPVSLGPAAVTVAVESDNPTPLTDALDSLLKTPSVQLDVLTSIANAIPAHTRIQRDRAVRIGALIVDAHRAGAAPPPSLLGRLRRRHLDAKLPDLATSLNNLSVRLGELNRHKESFAAIEEAVRIRRQLARVHPDAHLDDLAIELNNLSVRLGELNRHKESLAAIEEAVRIRRQLARVHPDAHLDALATELNNLSLRLTELGRQKDALPVIEEAASVYLELAKAHPGAYLHELATSLNNLSRALGGVGRREEALVAIQGAVRIRRQLAASNPDAHLPHLARELNNLGVALDALDRHEESRAAMREAVELYGRLGTSHLSDLAASLMNLMAGGPR